MKLRHSCPIMIELNRFNGDKFALNALLIEQVQALPDTTITLVNGKKIIVKNSLDEVLQLTKAYYREIGLQLVLKQVGEPNE